MKEQQRIKIKMTVYTQAETMATEGWKGAEKLLKAFDEAVAAGISVLIIE